MGNLDLSAYEEQKQSLMVKSGLWANLPETPHVSTGVSSRRFNFNCSPEDVIQVFHISKSDLSGSGYDSYSFNENCPDKTILINVGGTGNYNVSPKTMNWTDKNGNAQAGGHEGFNSCMNSAILWNFFEPNTVSMSGTGEWQGSILVNGNFNFETIGQSGRTMVIGDLVQDKQGSEFHNFEFKPPKPLPGINCDGLSTRAPVAPIAPVPPRTPLGPSGIPPGIPQDQRTCQKPSGSVGNGVCPRYVTAGQNGVIAEQVQLIAAKTTVLLARTPCVLEQQQQGKVKQKNRKSPSLFEQTLLRYNIEKEKIVAKKKNHKFIIYYTYILLLMEK